MITTRMTIPEMIKEYWLDEEILSKNCIRLGNAIFFDSDKKKRKALAKEIKPDDISEGWWKCKSVREYHINKENICDNLEKGHQKKNKSKIGSDIFRVILRYRTEGYKIMCSIIAYTILKDCDNGKNLVILWPEDKGKNYLVKFDSKFFTEYQEQRFPGQTVSFQDVVDDYMTYNNGELTVYGADNDNDINLEIKFNYGYGLGHVDKGPEDSWRCYTAKHYFSVEKIEEMREKVGGEDVEMLTPTKLWNAYQEAIAPKKTVTLPQYSDDYDWEEEQRKEREKILEELSMLDDY